MRLGVSIIKVHVHTGQSFAWGISDGKDQLCLANVDQFLLATTNVELWSASEAESADLKLPLQ
jgi:hypothetical protein